MTDSKTATERLRELLPCPFCGGEAELKRYQSGDWQVICYHADGCIMHETDLDNCYWENVQVLARQWNTRAERTCEIVGSYYYDDYNQYEFEFSCGHSVNMYDKEPPNYCPNCGRKVEQ